jgi:hypothetical protein
MNGQSLPQLGREVLPGQHGMSSIAGEAIEPAAMNSPIDACVAPGMAIAGCTIGAKASPTTANKARKNPALGRCFIILIYRNLQRMTGAQAPKTRWATFGFAFRRGRSRKRA